MSAIHDNGEGQSAQAQHAHHVLVVFDDAGKVQLIRDYRYVPYQVG